MPRRRDESCAIRRTRRGRRSASHRHRINTIIDYETAQRLGVHTQGAQAITNARLLGELVGLVAEGRPEIPIAIAKTYPLKQVRETFTELADRHTHEKIVLLP
jgi:NADPH2:quinone reductase